MKKSLLILRNLLFSMVFAIIAIPILLYIVLSTGWAQNDIRNVATNEISALLGSEVQIGSVEIHPFNRISINHVTAKDDFGNTAVDIDEISVAFELFHLLRTGELTVDFALIDNPVVNIFRNTDDSPLNIAGLLSHLKSGNPDKPRSHYNLSLNTVVLRNGCLTYNINDKEQKPDGLFDKNHIDINGLYLNAYIPRLSSDDYRVEIDRLSFKEGAGFTLSELACAVDFSSDSAVIDNLTLVFPHSEFRFAPFTARHSGLCNVSGLSLKDTLAVTLREGSFFTPADFKSFLAPLASLQDTVSISARASIADKRLTIESLNLSEPHSGFSNVISASVDGLADTIPTVSLDQFRLLINPGSIASDCPASLKTKAPWLVKYLNQLRSGNGLLSINVSGHATAVGARLNAGIAYAGNAVKLNVQCSTTDTFRSVSYKAAAIIDCADIGRLTAGNPIEALRSAITASGHISRAHQSHNIINDSTSITVNGNTITPVSFTANYNEGSSLSINLYSRDKDCNIAARLYIDDLSDKSRRAIASLEVFNLLPAAVGYTKSPPSCSVATSAKADVTFSNINDATGVLHITDLKISDYDDDNSTFNLGPLTLRTYPSDDTAPGLSLKSNIVNGNLSGHYRLSTIKDELAAIASGIFPAIIAPKPEYASADAGNDFTFDFTISPCDKLCKLVKSPLSVIHTVELNGHVAAGYNTMALNLCAPYLLNGDKLIENTVVKATACGYDRRASLSLVTKMPTKKGPLALTVESEAFYNKVSNHIDWLIERRIPINGAFDFSNTISRDFNNELAVTTVFQPGKLTFGNDVWEIHPSTVDYSRQVIDFDNFILSTTDKSIAINGCASADADSDINIRLSNIELLDIFETLEIDKALIGGNATGTVVGRSLLSPTPQIECDSLSVEGISYNRCTLGDAIVAARWDNDTRSFVLDADICGADSLHSSIAGSITPEGEGIDITFDVNHAPVGFMKPFMEAFADDLSGYASGHARLFGTFKYIDMEGDIAAEDLRLKIAFTNTWYSASDSIKLTPGRIMLDKVVISDVNGNTALLTGEVRHVYFKEPSFEFNITDAHNFLSYNVDASLSPDWYGTIYGNGRASVSGEPGVVNIGVNMSTAPKSWFNFVLSDRMDADDYSFITFKDSRAEARRDSLAANDPVPAIIRSIKEHSGSGDGSDPSAYNMDFQIGITPDARITLVMDPISGDEIKAYGSGNLGMYYHSQNNDLKMYGTYTLDRGNYNFTLQDIIIKDFTIKDGSTIAFHGDPYSAQLDIKAIYAVNANLSDLDESFLLDKDLNRTNVPVHALLEVSGDIRQPEIDFDLEFPTLTQDTYRKVRSIVSTKEMMNRQIIYLLALNRFYTPDYMASTTKGNELFSVASSTIASQLGNMLGKLSDDWSIAPNLRSDRGDFSDVEVDVALSSRLLNNRLLFNGNFGYRDKTLNTNQFIGDFDIEYLINPKGAWRLKAYNRYNDQNYYVRTAQTTQGLGLIFKKDFDNLFGFLRRKKPQHTPPATLVPSTSVTTVSVSGSDTPDGQTESSESQQP